jgi:hypothetical protein
VTCNICQTELTFSCRQRGDGLCGPCSRRARGEQSHADEFYDLEERVRVASMRATARLDQIEASGLALVDRANAAQENTDRAIENAQRALDLTKRACTTAEVALRGLKAAREALRRLLRKDSHALECHYRDCGGVPRGEIFARPPRDVCTCGQGELRALVAAALPSDPAGSVVEPTREGQ